MKKILKLLVAPLMLMGVGTSISSCSYIPKEIALITDVGDIDDGGFNQESWLAVKEYAQKHHKSYDFYRPFNNSDFARICAIRQAVAKGAKFIVLPGYMFAVACDKAADDYPDVHFLLLDSCLSHPKDNVCCIGYKSEESGFAAGYAIATDLVNRDIASGGIKNAYGYGYMGGQPSSGVYQFGYGYIQGIVLGTQDACSAASINASPNININFDYAGVFAQSDPAVAEVKTWLASNRDIKVVFPCGGKLNQSIIEACQYYNKHDGSFDYDKWINGKLDKDPRNAARWVGVDSDQLQGLKYNYEKKSIYTSALKGLEASITDALNYHYETDEVADGDGWWCIGGDHTYNYDSSHQKTAIENPYFLGSTKGGLYQWYIGMRSIFGDIAGRSPTEDDYNDYTGIPMPKDGDQTTILTGFDNYTVDDYKAIYNKIIATDASKINVYSGDGTEYGAPQGIPYEDGAANMVNWTGFKSNYLGNYSGTISIKKS